MPCNLATNSDIASYSPVDRHINNSHLIFTLNSTPTLALPLFLYSPVC